MPADPNNPPHEKLADPDLADPVLLWLCGPDGKAEFFSPSWLAFTGRTPAELLGDGWYADVHDDDGAPLAAAVDEAIAERVVFRLKLRLRRHDGHYVPFACDSVVRIDREGKFCGLISICTDITRIERERTEIQLANRHFVDLLPQTELVTVALDNSGHVLFFNPALTALLGTPASDLSKSAILGRFVDLQQRPLSELLFPGGRRVEPLPARIESEFIEEGSDAKRILLWHPIPLRDYSGNQSGIILVGDDLTEPRRAEEKLRLTARVFETTALAMIITDPGGAILSANQAFTRLTGYGKDEAIGNNPRMLQSGRHDRDFYKAMWESLLSTGSWQGEIWDKRKDGSVYPKFTSIHALRDEQGAVTHYAGIFYDISERKAAEERLTHLAHFDALTELPNRSFFLDKLRRTCHDAAAGKGCCALIFLDLDHFKEINDTMGHQAGDHLLRETGRRLRAATRSQDMAARIGGDEFAVLLSDVKDAANAAMVAQKIIESFEPPVMLGAQAIAVTPSIGIALCPDHAGDPDTLLRLADEAMYRAKLAGRNAYRFFDT